MPEDLLPVSAVKKSSLVKLEHACTRLPREKNLYLFSSFFTYTSKYQNDPLFAEVAFLPHARASVHEARACAERRPELIGHYCARKICIYFPPFFTYTSKYQNVTLFFDWMSHNGARIVSGESTSKRLKNPSQKVASTSRTISRNLLSS